MTIAESILPELEMEMAGTRKTLERIPADKLDWRVHPKSNTIGWVACHLAKIPGWVDGVLTQDAWDTSRGRRALISGIQYLFCENGQESSEPTNSRFPRPPK